MCCCNAEAASGQAHECPHACRGHAEYEAGGIRLTSDGGSEPDESVKRCYTEFFSLIEGVSFSLKWVQETLKTYSTILGQLSQEPLQSLRREPQHLHQVVLGISHPEPKQNISNVMPSQQHSAEPHQAHPQYNEDPHRWGQHKVSQQEAPAHGGAGGMPRGEGVAIHRKRGKHVHLVMSRPTSTHHSLHKTNQDQVQQKTCK